MSMVTVTVDDLGEESRHFTKEELEALDNWVDTDFNDCHPISEWQIQWVKDNWDKVVELRKKSPFRRDIKQ